LNIVAGLTIAINQTIPRPVFRQTRLEPQASTRGRK
jgi:hypothetical protein